MVWRVKILAPGGPNNGSHLGVFLEPVTFPAGWSQRLSFTFFASGAAGGGGARLASKTAEHTYDGSADHGFWQAFDCSAAGLPAVGALEGPVTLTVELKALAAPDGPSAWACGACTFENAPGLGKCEMCDTPKPAPEAAAAADGSRSSGAAVRIGDSAGSGPVDPKTLVLKVPPPSFIFLNHGFLLLSELFSAGSFRSPAQRHLVSTSFEHTLPSHPCTQPRLSPDDTHRPLPGRRQGGPRARTLTLTLLHEP